MTSERLEQDREWSDPELEQGRGELVWRRVEELQQRYSARYENYRRAYQYLAGDESLALSDNVLAEAHDAIVSELIQSPIRVVLAGKALSFKERRKARMSTWYADAAYAKHRLARLQNRMISDAVAAGIGHFIVQDTDDGPIPERVHPLRLWMDDAECIDAAPDEIIVGHDVPKRELIKDYPEMESEIEGATRMMEQADVDPGRDSLLVLTAYRGGTEDEPGRCVVALPGVSEPLLDEEWTDSPPWGWVVVAPKDKGLVGHSLLLRAESKQLEIDRINGTIQDGSISAVPWLFYDKGRIVDEKHFENRLGLAIPTDGPPDGVVKQYVPVAVHAENYKRIQELRQGIFNSMHASEQFSTGQVPSNVSSGKMVRNLREIQNRRHLATQQELEWAMERLIVELLKGEQRASKRKGGHKVTVSFHGVTRQVAASKMLLDPDQVQVTARASSNLPLEPGVRIEQVQELLAADVGFDAEDFFEVTSDIVDFEGPRRRVTAPRRIIEMQIEQMLEDGDQIIPPKFLPVEAKRTGLRLGTAILCDAMIEEAAEDRLALVRQYLGHLATQIDEATAPPPPPPGMPGPPGMPPGPLPPGPLLPPDPMGPPPMPPPPGGIPGPILGI